MALAGGVAGPAPLSCTGAMVEIVGDRFMIVEDPNRAGTGGQVLRAADGQSGGQSVAIKFIKGHRDDPTTRLLFDKETGALQRLDHPNVVRMLDAGWHADRQQFYIALEWVDQSMVELLKNPPWGGWDDFCDEFALPLSDALAHAHLKNVEHRDIKPGNILVQAGTPKLADFGIAKLRDKVEPLAPTLQEWHTPPYVPPDFAVGYEKTRDVWALGVVFIRSMSGVAMPGYDELYAALADIDVPPDVRELLSRCVSDTADDRPANGSVLAAELSALHGARRARMARRAAPLYLRMTQRAATELAGATADRQQAASVVATDVGAECCAEFRLDPETAQIDRRTVFLYGRKWRFSLKPDEDRPRLSITSARALDGRQADMAKRFAWRLDSSLNVTFSSPGDDVAAVAFRRFMDGLEEHQEQREVERKAHGARRLEAAPFERWLALLEAREELERGERRPLQYTSMSASGREATFTLEETLEREMVGEEWDVRFGPGGHSIARGEVVEQVGDAVVLRFARLRKRLPDRGQLTPNLGASQAAHNRQMDAVRRILDGTAVRPDLRTLIADPSTVRPPTPANIQAWYRTDLDAGKREAVAAAVGSPDFLLVEGPPGTGKTSFITETVAQCLRQNPNARVLIVSQTHVAVDNALERLEAAGIEGIVRLGLPDDPRVDPEIRHLLLDKQMEQWAARVRARAEQHLRKMAQSAGVADRHLHAALLLERLATVLASLAHVEQLASAAMSTTAEGTMTGADQLRDRVEIQERLDALLEQRGVLMLEAQRTLEGDLTLRDDWTAGDARAAVTALVGADAENAPLLRLVALQAEWLQRVATDQKLASAYLRTVRVLAGTCVGFLGHPAVRDLEFDLCILDEASRATATESLVPLARSRRWILVGDTKQLPPMDEEVLRAPEVMQRHELDEAFVRTTLFDRLVEAVPAASRVLLREQYRMIRAIGDLISSCFYKEALRSPNDTGLPGFDILGKPVLWLDTSRLGAARHEESLDRTSPLNRLEARLAMQRLEVFDGAIERGLLKPNGPQLSVLVMAPYRRQVEELDRSLAKLRLKHIRAEVRSVDAVQGREADAAILSLTRSNERGYLGFLAAPYWRRINVALSRARYSLTVVGDMDMWLSREGALREVALYIREHANACEVREADRG